MLYIRLLLFFLLLSSCCLAQQDYIVTLSKDTLHGKINRGNLQRNAVSIKINGKKKKINFSEIKNWRQGNNFVEILKDSTSKRTRYHELQLEEDGKARLLWDVFYGRNRDHYLQINNQYIPFTTYNIEKFIWPELLKCNMFHDRYHVLSIKKVKQIFFKHNPKDLKDIIRYYNQYCDTNE